MISSSPWEIETPYAHLPFREGWPESRDPFLSWLELFEI